MIDDSRGRVRARLFALALISSGAAACGSILGIGDPIVETEGGALGDAGRDATNGGGSVGRDGRADGTLEASETGADGSQVDATEDASEGGEDAGSDVDAAEAEACPAGQIVCGNGCVDPMGDPNNCNGCGNVCIHGQSCNAGTCECPTGQSVCPGAEAGVVGDAMTSGTAPYCADLQTDPDNCNGCGSICPTSFDTPTCVGGVCHSGTCTQGFADCNGQASDGCEIYTQTDISHCGNCATACVSGQLCSSGQCVFTCPAGQTVCHTGVSGTSGDGGSSDAASDAKGDAANDASSTDASADAGAGDGGTLGAPYCSTLPTDPQNCGACGNDCAGVCPGAVSAYTCTAGVCGIQNCQSGYYDIDGVCANGCECKVTPTATCASPIGLGVVAIGTTVMYTGNLAPAASTYLQVTFTGNTSSTYHPRIRFTTNVNDEFAFDLVSNCSGTSFACGDETTVKSVGLSEWEQSYMAGLDYGLEFAPIPAVGTVLIRIYRNTNAPVDCNTYTLVIDN